MDRPGYTESEKRTLACVLDVLVPPDPRRGLPGAGEIGLADVIEGKAPDLHPTVAPGLAALDELARERGADAFALAPPGKRAALVEALGERHPGFVPGLVFQTFVAYYEHPAVQTALGLEARPPHPLGYELEAGDLSRLASVRARGRLYREVAPTGPDPVPEGRP